MAQHAGMHKVLVCTGELATTYRGTSLDEQNLHATTCVTIQLTYPIMPTSIAGTILAAQTMELLAIVGYLRRKANKKEMR